MHRFLPLASYRFKTEAASLERYQNPPRALLVDEITRDKNLGFYAYRMDFRDMQDVPRSVQGVCGILELNSQEFKQSAFNLDSDDRLDKEHILVHEQTIPSGMPSPPDDTTTHIARIGAGPIWGIALNDNIPIGVDRRSEPISSVADTAGVLHRVWRIENVTEIELIRGAVENAQIIIADGHHRFARSVDRLSRTDKDIVVRLLCYITNLKSLEAEIRPIHRCFKTAFPLEEIIERLNDKYVISEVQNFNVDEQTPRNYLILAVGAKMFQLSPRNPPSTSNDAYESQNVARLLQAKSTQYLISKEKLIEKVHNDSTKVGLLTRAITISQIKGAALSKRPLPPKSTLFYPKPLPGFLLGERLP